MDLFLNFNNSKSNPLNLSQTFATFHKLIFKIIIDITHCWIAACQIKMKVVSKSEIKIKKCMPIQPL